MWRGEINPFLRRYEPDQVQRVQYALSQTVALASVAPWMPCIVTNQKCSCVFIQCYLGFVAFENPDGSKVILKDTGYRPVPVRLNHCCLPLRDLCQPWHTADQLLGVVVLRLFNNLAGFVLFNDPPLLHDQYSMGETTDQGNIMADK